MPRIYRPGSFLRLPLADGSFGYGRVLKLPHDAYYDYRTHTPDSDLERIASKPILFKIMVRHMEERSWELIGWRKLEEQFYHLVVPKPEYLPGERVRVTVRFADGAVPASASFWLVGHAERGTRRVEVYRQPRPADAFRREAADAQAEAHQCREEKAQLLSERREPGGLMGAAWLEQGGTVATKDYVKPKIHAGSALIPRDGKVYSFTPDGGSQVLSLSVRLRLANASAEPWMTAGAALLDLSGEQVDLAVFQPAPILASATGTVVVGTEKAPGLLACPCTLKLWEAPGFCVVTLGNILLPEVPKPRG